MRKRVPSWERMGETVPRLGGLAHLTSREVRPVAAPAPGAPPRSCLPTRTAPGSPTRVLESVGPSSAQGHPCAQPASRLESCPEQAWVLYPKDSGATMVP